jgi:hypothetical protein
MSDTSSEELTKFFEDILKNKDLILEMVNTNILMYDEKIKANKEKIGQIKENQEKLQAENQAQENKLKSEYAKYHEQLQKHEVNFKLLDRTGAHYKSLIKEREDEIRKYEEQSIYCYQDYQNKKMKLDCLNVQIVEAEFQLKNLQRLMDEKINSLVNPKKSENQFQNISLDSSTTTTNTKQSNIVNVTENIEPSNDKEKQPETKTNQQNKNSQTGQKKRKTNIFGEVVNEEKQEKLLSSYTEQSDGINLNKSKKCVIY